MNRGFRIRHLTQHALDGAREFVSAAGDACHWATLGPASPTKTASQLGDLDAQYKGTRCPRWVPRESTRALKPRLRISTDFGQPCGV